MRFEEQVGNALVGSTKSKMSRVVLRGLEYVCNQGPVTEDAEPSAVILSVTEPYQVILEDEG